MLPWPFWKLENMRNGRTHKWGHNPTPPRLAVTPDPRHMVCKLRLRAFASPKEEDGSAGENVVEVRLFLVVRRPCISDDRSETELLGASWKPCLCRPGF